MSTLREAAQQALEVLDAAQIEEAQDQAADMVVWQGTKVRQA